MAYFLVEKIREGLIHNAKVKRAYYRTLKREEKAGTLAPRIPLEDTEVFPSMKALLIYRNWEQQTWIPYIHHDHKHYPYLPTPKRLSHQLPQRKALADW